MDISNWFGFWFFGFCFYFIYWRDINMPRARSNRLPRIYPLSQAQSERQNNRKITNRYGTLHSNDLFITISIRKSSLNFNRPLAGSAF